MYFKYPEGNTSQLGARTETFKVIVIEKPRKDCDYSWMKSGYDFTGLRAVLSFHCEIFSYFASSIFGCLSSPSAHSLMEVSLPWVYCVLLLEYFSTAL